MNEHEQFPDYRSPKQPHEIPALNSPGPELQDRPETSSIQRGLAIKYLINNPEKI